MASKAAKTLQVKDKEKDDKAADAPEKDFPGRTVAVARPVGRRRQEDDQAGQKARLRDLSISSTKCCRPTHPPREQIEDIMSMLSDMGINVSEAEDADSEEEKQGRGRGRDRQRTGRGHLRRPSPRSRNPSPVERTDDPVRMYLREMGTVELLSREGEIAIAKRIEAGREAMIAGLCESPLTFQAIIIWRDELNEGNIFLRDIIDLEATYAGPDAKNNMNPKLAAPLGADGQPQAAANGNRAAAVQSAPAHGVAPPAAPPAPTPFSAPRPPPPPRAKSDLGGVPAEGDMDDDEFENPDVARRHRGRTEAEGGRDLRQDRRQLQEAAPPAGAGHFQPAAERDAVAGAGAQIQEAEGRDHRRGEVAAAQPGPHRFAGRAAHDINKKLVGRSRAACCASATATASRARTSCATTRARSWIRAGSTASPNSRQRAGRISSITKRTASRSCATISNTLARIDRAGDRRIPQDRARACRRASARRARPRRKWSRPICVW